MWYVRFLANLTISVPAAALSYYNESQILFLSYGLIK